MLARKAHTTPGQAQDASQLDVPGHKIEMTFSPNFTPQTDNGDQCDQEFQSVGQPQPRMDLNGRRDSTDRTQETLQPATLNSGRDSSAIGASSPSDTSLGFNSLPNVSCSLSRHDLSERFSSVPSATHDRTLHPALVWRRTRCLDQLACCSSRPACWLVTRTRIGWDRSRNVRLQAGIHIGLLLASLAFLPLHPNAAIWKPVSAADPSGRILLLLTVTVGGPYLLLSATAPLLQRWFTIGPVPKNRPGDYMLFRISDRFSPC